MSFSDEALGRGRNAKYDVYDYAARFFSTPRFYYRVAKLSPEQNDKVVYQTVVELPGRDIKAKGEGFSVRNAETAACLNFFKEADRYKAHSPMIKEPLALQLSNVKKFWEWYQVQHPETEFNEDGPSHVGNCGLLKAQLLADGKPLGDAVVLFGDAGQEEKLELLAYLTAAIALQNDDTGLFRRYLEAHGQRDGQPSETMAPIDVEIDAESVTVMDQAINRMPDYTVPSRSEDITLSGSWKERKDQRRRSRQALVSLALRRRLEAFNKDPQYEQLRTKKAALPMNHYRSEVVELVEKNICSIIMGAPGSGKTTQVPQIILEQAIAKYLWPDCNIMCTQPRRIAATSVARRVASERRESLQQTSGTKSEWIPSFHGRLVA